MGAAFAACACCRLLEVAAAGKRKEWSEDLLQHRLRSVLEALPQVRHSHSFAHFAMRPSERPSVCKILLSGDYVRWVTGDDASRQAASASGAALNSQAGLARHLHTVLAMGT